MTLTWLVHLGERVIGVLVLILELFGSAVLVYGAAAVFVRFFRLKYHQSSTDIRMRFARTISLGLEFFLAAEVMKTISVRQFQELYVVAAIVLLRAMMTFLIHWEMDHDARALRDECELERSLRVDD